MLHSGQSWASPPPFTPERQLWFHCNGLAIQSSMTWLFDKRRRRVSSAGKRINRKCAHAALLIVCVGWINTASLASQPGPVELARGYLQEAASGDLRNVILVRWMNGYVRTTYILSLPGSHRDLSEVIDRTEHRGNLTIEYSTVPGLPGMSVVPSVLIYDRSDYIQLTGAATSFSNEFVKAFVALSGPPDITSSDWKPLPQ